MSPLYGRREPARFITEKEKKLAPQFTSAFGFKRDYLGDSAVTGVRIVSVTLFVRSLLMLFFVYYFLTSRRGPMYLITILNDLAAPLAFGFLGALIMGRQEGVWIGIAVAPVFTLLVCALVILFVYGKKSFPYLMPFRNEEKIFIYSFPLSSENTAAMAETAGSLLTEENYPGKTGKFVELVLEEVLMLIREKNPEAEKS